MLVTPTNESMYPTEIQSRLSQTIQTHNAVSVGASVTSQSSWIDTLGFANIATTFKNDGSTTSQIDIQWSHDGSNIHGWEAFIASSTSQYKQASTPIKARYARIGLYNGDVASHTMSNYVYITT